MVSGLVGASQGWVHHPSNILSISQNRPGQLRHVQTPWGLYFFRLIIGGMKPQDPRGGVSIDFSFYFSLFRFLSDVGAGDWPSFDFLTGNYAQLGGEKVRWSITTPNTRLLI
jgi:hypothetical protein